MFGSIVNVLDTLVENAGTLGSRARASVYLEACKTFKVAQLVVFIDSYFENPNELNVSLQEEKKNKLQATANSMLLVQVAKRILQTQHILVVHTVFHHYHVDVFCKVNDWKLQELNELFDEATTDLLHGVVCLNQIDSFPFLTSD